jgi:hypothetical protein
MWHITRALFSIENSTFLSYVSLFPLQDRKYMTDSINEKVKEMEKNIQRVRGKK